MKIAVVVIGILFLLSASVSAEKLSITVHMVSAEGIGKPAGTIDAIDTKWGLLLTPNLSGLPAGMRGFHVHEHANCASGENQGKPAAAHQAGSHFDPGKSGKHLGPYAEGHLGDLPPLHVDADGKATLPVLAPRLKTSDLKGHAVMIHAGGDNFSDQPQPLGGGGGRIACGPVK